jgi:hypothetical protein
MKKNCGYKSHLVGAGKRGPPFAVSQPPIESQDDKAKTIVSIWF